MKILIIDDETIVRFGMRYIIPWEKHGFEVVGEASNGIEAIKLAKQYQPDIILTDIVMPKMDGLDFIEKIKKDLPKTKFIIFSCHDNIEFYRKAIKLGVCEYIQKSSISPQEILNTVNEVAAKIKAENENLLRSASNQTATTDKNILEKEFFSYILENKFTDFKNKLTALNLKIDEKHPFYIIVFKVFEESYEIKKDTYIKVNFKSLDKNLLASLFAIKNTSKHYSGNFDFQIKNFAKNILDSESYISGYVLNPYECFFIEIIFFRKNISNPNEYLKNLCYRLSENISQIFNLKLSFGISNKETCYAKLNQSYLNALDALNNCYFQGIGKIFLYEEIKNLKKTIKNAKHLLNQEIYKIYKTRYLFEIEQLLESIEKIYQIIAGGYVFSEKEVKSIYIDIIYHLFSILRNENLDILETIKKTFNLIDFIETPKTYFELNYKIENLINIIKNYYSYKFKQNETKIISFINDYIKNHLGEKISLKKLAEYVHLNPSYLSRLYKNYTNINIQRYKINLKIEKSKEMLMQGYNISYIVEKIGFFSESHFFKTFKKITGMTPKQYKNFILQKINSKLEL